MVKIVASRFIYQFGDTPNPDLEGQQPVPPDLPERQLQVIFNQRLKG